MKGSGACVLVVDDLDQWRRLVSAALKKQGLHVIEEAADGPEALQKAEDLQPDLIVLDIGLPTLNGIDVARQIRTVSRKSKVVFLTENQSCDVAEAALNEGASGYVIKSAFARELMPAIKAALEGKHFLSAKLTALTPRPELA